MSDQTDPNTETEQETSAETTNTDTDTPGPIPYERFKEVNDQLKALKEELNQLKGTDDEEEEDPLERAISAMKKFAEAQMEDLDDSYKSLLSRLSPADQLEWLAENGKEIRKKPNGIPQTPDGGKQGDLSEEKRRKQAAKTF